MKKRISVINRTYGLSVDIISMILFMMLVLAAVFTLIFAGGIRASASVEIIDSKQNGTSSIKIENTVKGETYKIYKVFDATASGKNVAYTYDGSNKTLLAALQADGSPFDCKDNGDGVYGISKKTNKEDTALTDFVKAQSSNLGETIAEFTGNGDIAEVSNLKLGYYYITTTTGTLVTINTANGTVTVKEKNTVPEIKHEQKKEKDSSYTDSDIDLNIGDTVDFRTTVTIGKGNDGKITVTEDMSEGLTWNEDSISVKNGETELTKGTDYNVEKDANDSNKFKITLTETYVKEHNNADDDKAQSGESVVVTYTAAVNKDAAINNKASGDKNTSTVTMEYSKQSVNKIVNQTTEDFLLKKVDSYDKFLDGAGFRIYTDENCTNEFKLSEEAGETGTPNKYYHDKSGTSEIKVNSEDGVNIRGLEAGTYYLKETTTPDGYNTAQIAKVVVAQGNTVEVKVENVSGSLFPTTGGVGTTVFYIAGGLLIVVSAAVLIMRRRKNKA